MTTSSAMRSIGLAGAMSLLAAGAAQASIKDGPAPPKPSVQAAPEASAQGHVLLRCKVTPERMLDACEVASEAPAGHGLGQAALDMAKGVKINDGTFRPEMVGRTIEIPMAFARDEPTEGEEPVAKMP